MARFWTIIPAAIRAFIADDALSRGAAIAYYAVFAIAPILGIAIAVTSFVFGNALVQDAIIKEFSSLMGQEAAALMQQMITSVIDRKGSVLSTLVGIGALVVTATGVFAEMQAALNAIWKAQPPQLSLSMLLRARLVGLGLILALGFLLIVSLIASAALSALGAYLQDVFPGLPLLLAALDLFFSLCFITVIVGAIYKFLPDTSVAWEDVGAGAVFTAVLLTAGKGLIGLYIGSSVVASTYGPATAFVVILLWVYYCAQIILLGAELTCVYAQRNHLPNAAARPPLKHF